MTVTDFESAIQQLMLEAQRHKVRQAAAEADKAQAEADLAILIVENARRLVAQGEKTFELPGMKS
jgi:hypothetical protein